MELNLANLPRLPRLNVVISPQRYELERLTAKQCIEVVSSSQVRARGWYFPHINRDGITSGPGGTYVMDQTELRGEHLEQWRMYKSGQFLIQMMPWEVPNAEVQETMRENARHWDSAISVNDVPGFLSFIMMILSVTEVCIFAARLAQAARYDTAVEIEVSLRGIKGWAIGSNDFAVDLYGAYVAKTDTVEYAKTAPLDGLIANPLGEAVIATQTLLEQFGWFDIAPETIENWQRRYFK